MLSASRFTGRGGELALVALLAFYMAAITLWPLGRLFWEALAPDAEGRPLGLMAEVLGARSTARAFWNTLWSSSVSVVVSAVLGVGLALATGLFRLRGRLAMDLLILSPLLVPSQIMALAWIQMFGSGSPVLGPILGPLGLAPAPGTPNPLYSGWGVALLMGVEHVPLVFLATRAALTGLPADLVEAARTAGAGGARILAFILTPLILPAALAGSLLAFAAAIGNFGAPALLGIPGRFTVLTTLIYQRLNGFGPAAAGRVAALALILAALALAALAIRAALLRRLTVPVGGGAPLRPFEIGAGARALMEAAIWTLLLVVAIGPMAALAATALTPALGLPFSLSTITPRHFAEAFANPAITRAFANSTILALATATICAVAAIPFAFLRARTGSRLIRLLDWLADAPWAIPGTVAALAMILAFLRPLPLIGSLYGSFAILLTAYLARFLPLVLRPAVAAAQALEPAQDEAARILGAGLWRRIFVVAAPALTSAVASGALLAALTAFNELTLSALLWSGGNETVGVMIFALQQEGASPTAAAVSLISVAGVAAAALAAKLAARLRHRRVTPRG